MTTTTKISLTAEVKNVVFSGNNGYYAVIELHQEYLDDAFRILGDFRLAVSKDQALQLIDTKFLEVTVESNVEEPE